MTGRLVSAALLVTLPTTYLVPPRPSSAPTTAATVHLRPICNQVASMRMRANRYLLVIVDAAPPIKTTTPIGPAYQQGTSGVRWITTEPGLSFGQGMIAGGTWARFLITRTGVFRLTFGSNQCTGPITANPNAPQQYNGAATRLTLSVSP